MARAGLLLSLDRREEAAAVLAEAEAELVDPAMAPGMWQVDRWRTRGVLARLAGDKAGTVEAVKQARAALREYVGSEEHPLFSVAFALEEIRAGQYDAGEASLTRARKLYERVFGADNFMMVELYLALGRLHEARGDDAAWFEAIGRADEILQRHPVDSMMREVYADVARNLGGALRARGRVDEAIAAYGRGIAALSASRVPAQDPMFAVLAASRADLLRAQGELQRGDGSPLERAEDDVAAALARFPVARADSDPGVMVYVLRVAADVSFARGDLADTRKWAGEGLQLLDRFPEPETHARLAFTLARALGQSSPRAQELARSSMAYFVGENRTGDASEVSDWIRGSMGESNDR